MSRFASFFIFAAILVALMTPSFALAQTSSFGPSSFWSGGSLVPCGTTANPTPCVACHLMALGQNLLNFFIFLSVFVATIMLAYAGGKYMFSLGNPAVIAAAHRIFMNVIIGFIIIIGSWIVINTIMTMLVRGPEGTTGWNWFSVQCVGMTTLTNVQTQGDESGLAVGLGPLDISPAQACLNDGGISDIGGGGSGSTSVTCTNGAVRSLDVPNGGTISPNQACLGHDGVSADYQPTLTTDEDSGSLNSPEVQCNDKSMQRTVSVNTGPVTGTGSGVANLTANPGISLSATPQIQQLSSVVGEASKALPEGYSVVVTSTDRPGSTVAGTGGTSQHDVGDAIDVKIVGPSGAVLNTGEDVTGLYTKLAVAAYSAQQTQYPALNGKLAWGGNFTTGPTNGPKDLMHFDLGGDRGRYGTLSALAQKAK